MQCVFMPISTSHHLSEDHTPSIMHLSIPRQGRPSTPTASQESVTPRSCMQCTQSPRAVITFSYENLPCLEACTKSLLTKQMPFSNLTVLLLPLVFIHDHEVHMRA